MLQLLSSRFASVVIALVAITGPRVGLGQAASIDPQLRAPLAAVVKQAVTTAELLRIRQALGEIDAAQREGALRELTERLRTSRQPQADAARTQRDQAVERLLAHARARLAAPRWPAGQPAEAYRRRAEAQLQAAVSMWPTLRARGSDVDRFLVPVTEVVGWTQGRTDGARAFDGIDAEVERVLVAAVGTAPNARAPLAAAQPPVAQRVPQPAVVVPAQTAPAGSGECWSLPGWWYLQGILHVFEPDGTWYAGGGASPMVRGTWRALDAAGQSYELHAGGIAYRAVLSSRGSEISVNSTPEARGARFSPCAGATAAVPPSPPVTSTPPPTAALPPPTAAPVPAPTAGLPMLRGYRVDHCLHWGRECGEPAASAWCQAQGYARATQWQVAPAKPTLVIGDGAVCNLDGCVAFTSVTCAQVAAPSPAPSPPAPTAAMVSLGCFPAGDLRNEHIESSSMTIQGCIAHCAGKGFAFAGIENGVHCTCGNTYGAARALAPARCEEARCSGSPNQWCGGYFANNIYATARTVTAPVATPRAPPSPPAQPTAAQPTTSTACPSISGAWDWPPSYNGAHFWVDLPGTPPGTWQYGGGEVDRKAAAHADRWGTWQCTANTYTFTRRNGTVYTRMTLRADGNFYAADGAKLTRRR
jgi:hypothetical protein